MGEDGVRVIVDNTGSAATSYTDSSAEDRQKHIYRVQRAGTCSGEGQRSKPAQTHCEEIRVARGSPSLACCGRGWGMAVCMSGDVQTLSN